MTAAVKSITMLIGRFGNNRAGSPMHDCYIIKRENCISKRSSSVMATGFHVPCSPLCMFFPTTYW